MAGHNRRETLGDYFVLQRGTTYKSRLLDQPGPVLLGLASIQRNGGFRTDSLRTYGGESPAKLLVQPGELYVSLKDVTQSADLLGAVARLPRDHPPGRLTQDTVKLEPKASDVSLDYLYWLMRTPQYRRYCRAHATGTTNLGLPREDFLAFPAPEPRRSQLRIVDLLNALDDKIELNRRMSETLEAMARALFKSWFIDFDPVRRNAARDRNQPSPRSPLPVGEGRRGEGAKHEGEGHYRGGYDFSGMLETARELRRKQTPPEEVFWELVRARRFMGMKFRRQHQLGDYIADFYCHEHRLVVELDGGVHSIKRKKDHKRDAWMQTQGFTVLRFPNEELLDDPEAALSAIAEAVLPSPTGRGAGGEGVVEGTAFDHLFPARLVDSELGEIPEGWEVGCVDDEFDLTMGQSPPGETYNEAGEGLPFYQGRTDFGFRFPTRRVYCTAPTRLAKAGDTLISVRAPVGDINMASEGCAIGRGVAAARHKTGSCSYSYQFIRSLKDVFDRFEAEGTVFGSIGKKDFHAIRCLIPPRRLVGEYERGMSVVDDRLELIEGESSTLAALRDTLLPKLISGEVRVGTGRLDERKRVQA